MKLAKVKSKTKNKDVKGKDILHYIDGLKRKREEITQQADILSLPLSIEQSGSTNILTKKCPESSDIPKTLFISGANLDDLGLKAGNGRSIDKLGRRSYLKYH